MEFKIGEEGMRIKGMRGRENMVGPMDWRS